MCNTDNGEITCNVVFRSDMLLDDTGGEGGRKEGRHVRIVVSLDEDSKWGEVRLM